MNVLVTGGAGYIGTELCKQLLLNNNRVTILDRLFWGYAPIQPLLDCFSDNLTVVPGDIRTYDYTKLEQPFDAVCHLAGLSNDPTADYNPSANYQMNVEATRRIVEYAKASGVQRFTFASSASVYDQDTIEQDLSIAPGMCDESTPIIPRGHYSITKKQAEDIVLQAQSSTFHPVVFRQGTVYGASERMRLDLVVNTFLKDAIINHELYMHGGGWMWRPLIDIMDCARAHVVALDPQNESRISGQIFNVLEENYQIRQLAMIVAGSLQMQDPSIRIKLIDAPAPKLLRNYRMTGSKVSNVLGFVPQVNVLSSVSNMLKQAPFTQTRKEELGNARYYNIRWMQELEEIFDLQHSYPGIY